ncbi:MAG: ChaN family lipoprotein [Nitrospira sp.]|nr:ChaN family lipoprotein [Nitrospira sp.]
MTTFSAQRSSSTRILSLLLLTIGHLLLTACTGSTSTIPANSPGTSWQAGRVIDVKTGRSIDLPTFLVTLTRFDVVYLGEEHYNQHHIDAALTVLQTVLANDGRPVLTMEMFGWDGQPALDEYLTIPGQDRQTFLDQSRWKQNWGGAFDNYEPLVNFSRAHRIMLQAMNPPKPLIRQVVKVGLDEARKGQAWTEWGMDREDIVDDQAYRVRILDQLKRCHGGGSNEDYVRMYEASMVRDEGMAKTVTAALLTARQRPQDHTVILSYTGGGHIQFNLPIPKRVARRMDGQVAQATVYLASFDHTRIEDIQDLVHDGIADYVWLTPMSQQGPPQRCR